VAFAKGDSSRPSIAGEGRKDGYASRRGGGGGKILEYMNSVRGEGRALIGRRREGRRMHRISHRPIGEKEKGHVGEERIYSFSSPDEKGGRKRAASIIIGKRAGTASIFLYP